MLRYLHWWRSWWQTNFILQTKHSWQQSVFIFGLFFDISHRFFHSSRHHFNLFFLNISRLCSYNEPQKLEWKNATKEEVLPSKYELKQNALVTFLMNMKTGTKVFQHFLMKTNLSHLVDGTNSLSKFLVMKLTFLWKFHEINFFYSFFFKQKKPTQFWFLWIALSSDGIQSIGVFIHSVCLNSPKTSYETIFSNWKPRFECKTLRKPPKYPKWKRWAVKMWHLEIHVSIATLNVPWDMHDCELEMWNELIELRF